MTQKNTFEPKVSQLSLIEVAAVMLNPSPIETPIEEIMRPFMPNLTVEQRKKTTTEQAMSEQREKLCDYLKGTYPDTYALIMDLVIGKEKSYTHFWQKGEAIEHSMELAQRNRFKERLMYYAGSEIPRMYEIELEKLGQVKPQIKGRPSQRVETEVQIDAGSVEASNTERLQVAEANIDVPQRVNAR